MNLTHKNRYFECAFSHAGETPPYAGVNAGEHASEEKEETDISFDDFERMAEEELAKLPEYVHEELNGGVLLAPEAYLHPARLRDDLYILGTYSVKPMMGKQIVLYYGSFLQTLPKGDAEAWRRQLRDTLRHEFLHHLETRAGLFYGGTLIEEDFERMMTYFMRHRAK